MSQILRRTFLSLALLVVAAAFLLLSDLHSRNGGRRATGGQSKTKVWRIQQVSYIETVLLEDAIHGFKTGLTEAGLKEDADYTIQSACAQGDVATLNSIIDAAMVNGVDMFVVYSTPTLQTAV